MQPLSDVDLSQDLIDWIAETAGAPVLDVRRQSRWRPQYFIDLDAPGLETVVLKRARAPRHVIERSALLSRFNTEREAIVLRALRDTEIRVPRYLGFHAEGGSLLMSKVGGSAQLHTVDDPALIRSIALDFAEELAALHRLDVNRDLTIPLPVPTDREELAVGNFLRFAEADLDTVIDRRPQFADPLLTLARSWVYRNFPNFDRPASLVQGDCGPDQFLFEHDKVTAIIDWELAHVGDPMVDLGAMRLRECLYPAGMFPIVLERYRELGMPTDDQAIRFYTVVTILFTLFGTIGGTARLNPRNEEVIQQLWWRVALRRALCEAIAEAEGIQLHLPDPVDDVDGGVDARLQQLLADRLHLLARRGGDWADELRPTLALADAIANSRRHGPLRDADLRDLQHLGVHADTLPEGMLDLERLIRANEPMELDRVLQTLYGLSAREHQTWLPLMRADRWVEDTATFDEDLRQEAEAIRLTPL